MEDSPTIVHAGLCYKEIAVKALLAAVLLSGTKKWRF